MKIRPSENLKEIKLLYVEDDSKIREVLAGMLARYAGRLFVASDGAEGLEIFKKERPDIVLTDIRMPKMDGLAMAREIKKIDPKSALIFATAFGDTEYLHKAIDIGAQGYLIKPIERDKLIEKLNFIGDAIVNARRQESYLKLIHALFNAQKDMLVLLDERGGMHLCNDAFDRFCRELGCERERSFRNMAERIETFREFLKMSDGDLHRALRKLDYAIVDLEGPRGRRFLKIHIKEVDRFMLMELTDVTDMKLEAAALEEESMIDALTQVYNRKITGRILTDVVEHGHGCIIMGDIDHFKEINDTYGHMVGDEVLKVLADRIRSRIRQEDFIVRWGGEEFLIVMQVNEQQALKIAEELRKEIEREPLVKVGKVTMSFGVCCAPVRNEEEFYELIGRADEALYAAKASGRNRVVGCREIDGGKG